MPHGFPADSGWEKDVSKPYLPNWERPSVLIISGAFPWLQFFSPLAYRPHPLVRRAQDMESEARTSIAAERDFITSLQAIDLAAAHALEDSSVEPASILRSSRRRLYPRTYPPTTRRSSPRLAMLAVMMIMKPTRRRSRALITPSLTSTLSNPSSRTGRTCTSTS
jgi:hypothetical protein